jgi:hypothetical protein
MPFTRHLTEDEIDAIYRAAIKLGLAGSRGTLLGSLDPHFREGLPKDPTPAKQLQSDLQELNTVERLEGAEQVIPLARWLSAAYQLMSIRPEAKVFDEAREKILRDTAARARTRAEQPPAPAAPPMAPANVALFQHHPAEPARPPQQPLSTTPFPATAVFLSIVGLTKMSGPEVPDALAALHRVLREPRAALPGLRVLSAVTGAVVLVPDSLNCNVQGRDRLPAWLAAIDAASLAVRVGVARGQAEWVEDADGTVNATGRGINIAARLAASELNPGVLYDRSYVDVAADLVRSNHFLHPDNQRFLSVEGKRGEVFACIADPTFQTRARNDIPEAPDAPPVYAVLLAYDLPGFSEGDLRTLASRFRDVSAEIRRLREQQILPPGAHVAFSPGGDGGVLAITGVPLERALGIATDLADKLQDASATRTADASVRARIGVHYGPTHAYVNAEDIARPTGHALFEADAIAGDAEARCWDAIIVSGDLVEGPSARWQEIAPFETVRRKKIRRFVKSGATRVPPPAAPATSSVPAATSAATAAGSAAPLAVAPATPPQQSLRWPDQLKGSVARQLCDAILSARPTREDLARTLAARLDMNLEAVAAPGNLENTIFALVRDAEAKGYTARLFDAVIADVPGNAALREFAKKHLT